MVEPSFRESFSHFPHQIKHPVMKRHGANTRVESIVPISAIEETTMTVYARDEAARKAVEMVQAALEAGLLKEIVACSFNNPEKSGRETAMYLGGMIRELTTQIAEL
jgi:hypothetical protein